MSNPDTKSCFVIAPIGDPDSEIRNRSDKVLKHLISPAVSARGYTAVRADGIDKPGLITSQVIQRIVDDSLVIADLTGRNPNVFYELAIRHALRKPLIQIIQKGEQIPFDVAGTRTIYVDHQDLDSVDSAKNEIISQIDSLETDPGDIETPISVSLDLQLLKRSEKPEERSLADLVAAVNDLRSSVGKVESKIGKKDQQGVLDEIQNNIKILTTRLDECPDIFRNPLFRRGHFHPVLLHEYLHIGSRRDPAFGILVIASLFRDWIPWLYELGMEAYRSAKTTDAKEFKRNLTEFREAIEFSIHSPIARDYLGRGGKEMYILMEEIEPMLHDVLREIEMKGK